MRRYEYPTTELLILTNKRIIEETKRTKGSIYTKAAVLLMRLVRRHPFESGNRRTAFLAAVNFLEVNKAKVNININKIENILQGVREGFYTIDEISKWLKGGDVHEFKRE